MSMNAHIHTYTYLRGSFRKQCGNINTQGIWVRDAKKIVCPILTSFLWDTIKRKKISFNNKI